MFPTPADVMLLYGLLSGITLHWIWTLEKVRMNGRSRTGKAV